MISPMQNVVHRIVFATDFSACSLKAFEHAVAWTKALDARLSVVHVVGQYSRLDIEEAIVQVNIEEQTELYRKSLHKFVSWAKAYLPEVRSELLLGIPADQVCQFALDRHSDLIVMGAHGWSGLDRVLMGSVAERVIYQAPCPVLVIRSKEEKSFDLADLPKTIDVEGHSLHSRHLLLPIDFSDCSLDAFEYGAQVAKRFSMSVTLLHAVEPLSYSIDFNLSHPIEDKALRNSIESRLSDLSRVLKQEGLRADYQIGDKPAVDSILKTIVDMKAGLVIMGTHGRRGLSRLIMGSITAGVLRRSFCPVLTVRSPRFKQEVSHPT